LKLLLIPLSGQSRDSLSCASSCGWNEEPDANAIWLGDYGEEVAATSHSKLPDIHSFVPGSNSQSDRGPTMIATTLHGAAILLKRSKEWDWFINLSASDYPLVTQDGMSAFLIFSVFSWWLAVSSSFNM
jgi:hypothetical protein